MKVQKLARNTQNLSAALVVGCCCNCNCCCCWFL